MAPKSFRIAPESLRAIPEDFGVTPNYFGAIPKDFRMIPESFGVAPKSLGIILRDSRIAPESFRVAPKSFRAIPEDFGVAPNYFGAIPKDFRMAPESFRGAPNYLGGVEDCVFVPAQAVARRTTMPTMAESITQRELRNDSGEIMRRLDQGESFIVTRNGVPVGELIPVRRHQFVATAAVMSIFRNAPAVDPDRFRADVDAWAGQDVLPHA